MKVLFDLTIEQLIKLVMNADLPSDQKIEFLNKLFNLKKYSN